MASSQEYVDFILEQLRDLPGVSARKMMGEYVLYCQGKVFGGVYDDRLMVKITEAGRALISQPVEQSPYQGAKPMFLVEDVDDREFLRQFVLATADDLPEPKPKAKKRRQTAPEK